MTQYVPQHGLQGEVELADLVENNILPGNGVNAVRFWKGCATAYGINSAIGGRLMVVAGGLPVSIVGPWSAVSASVRARRHGISTLLRLQSIILLRQERPIGRSRVPSTRWAVRGYIRQVRDCSRKGCRVLLVYYLAPDQIGHDLRDRRLSFDG